jgi:hypothetical protein
MMHPETKDFRTCNGYAWAVKQCAGEWESKGYYEVKGPIP